MGLEANLDGKRDQGKAFEGCGEKYSWEKLAQNQGQGDHAGERGKYLQNALRKEGTPYLWKPVGRPMCLEPSDRQERCEMQLEMLAGARPQDFAGHTKNFGFCSKCIRKALEDFRKKSDVSTRH